MGPLHGGLVCAVLWAAEIVIKYNGTPEWARVGWVPRCGVVTH